MFLQNPDDLLFRKAAALHALVLVGPERTSSGIKTEGQGQGVGTEAFIHVLEDDADKFEDDLHRRAEEEAKATEKACAKAKNTFSQNAVFPNDASKLKDLVFMNRDAVDRYRSAYARADINVELLVVECVAYKSTFDAKFHHTSYVLRIDIGDQDSRKLPPQSAEDQNVRIAVSPTNTYVAVAD